MLTLADAASCQLASPQRNRAIVIASCVVAGSRQLDRLIPLMTRTNEFAFKIATANGTGSASANGLIMQAIFRMGIPVTGKNVFPSNIQGLPTWYEIRVDKHGYTARTPHFDLMVAMNPATYQKDVARGPRSGGWLLYDSTWPLDQRLTRPDVTYLGIPLAEMCNATVHRRARAHPDEEHRLRRRAGGARSAWTPRSSGRC